MLDSIWSCSSCPAPRVHAFYCDEFVLPLPPGHRFPMRKYQLLRETVERTLPGIELRVPASATDAQLALAHTADYVRRVSQGDLSASEQREIGFPWSPAMVERARRSVGATIEAARSALRDGVACNLAGGTHHAYAGKGSGFCVFNDSVVAARLMQIEQSIAQVVIVDLDVHQGNGTAAILADDPSIFTLSIHGAANFPFRKESSDLDVGLPDGTGDDDYLAALNTALQTLEEQTCAGLVIYLAGADPHEGDRLGRLKLTVAGLAERDRTVFRYARRIGAPIVVSMAGGYGRVIEQTCSIHAQTVALAYDFYRHGRTRCAHGAEQAS